MFFLVNHYSWWKEEPSSQSEMVLRTLSHKVLYEAIIKASQWDTANKVRQKQMLKQVS
jgi:hypothetical protein